MPGKEKHSAGASNRRKSGDRTGRMFELSQPLLLDAKLAGEAENKVQSKVSFNGLLDHTDCCQMLFASLGVKEVRRLRAVSEKAKISAESWLNERHLAVPFNEPGENVYAHAWEKLNDLHDALCKSRDARRKGVFYRRSLRRALWRGGRVL